MNQLENILSTSNVQNSLLTQEKVYEILQEAQRIYEQIKKIEYQNRQFKYLEKQHILQNKYDILTYKPLEPRMICKRCKHPK